MRSRWLQHSVFLLTFVLLLGMARECLRLPERAFLGLSLWQAEVTQVRAGGPAAKAGLKVGDRLLGFSDAARVDSTDVRTQELRTQEPRAIDVGELPSPLTFLKERGTRPTRIFLQRRGQRLWAELVPRPLPTREQAWNLGLAGLGAFFLLLGAFTIVHRRGMGAVAWTGLCLVLSILLSPFGQDAATGGTRSLAPGLPESRAALLTLVLVVVALGFAMWHRTGGGLWRTDPERLARRWLIYLGLANLFVVLYFVGIFGLRQFSGTPTMAENPWGVGLALAFFALILSPLSERMIRSLDR